LLEHLTGAPLFYDYLGWAVLLLAAFNAAQIIYLLWNKARVERAERRKDALRRLTVTAVMTSPTPADLLAPPAGEEEYEACSEAIAGILENFEGEIAERALGLLERFGVSGHYRAMARGGRWYRRANAVDMLSVFRLEENRGSLLELFKKERVASVRYRILRALSLIARGHDDITTLACLLSELPYLTPKYTEDLFYNAVTALKAKGREEEFGLFMRRIMRDDRVLTLVKRDCLTACRAAACEKAGELFRDYYAAYPEEPEILAACVKALARKGDFSLLPDALRHPHWLVRLAALKNAHLCREGPAGEIAALLSDHNYHIRLNAALALARSGERGRAALRAAAASGDRFASDSASYALEQETA